MTENDLLEMGFDKHRTYTHDDWYTRRYTKGVLQAEFTYEWKTDKLDSFTVSITETDIENITLKELKQLDKTLNHARSQ